MFFYRNDHPSTVVRENLDRISEKIIQAIWHHLFLRINDLCTTDGQPLKILDQGNWNHDAGPDFKDAKIKIGAEILAGDIEIHWRSSDWRHHEHQSNDAYQHIILHAVFMDDEPMTDKKFRTLELNNYLNDDLYTLIEKIKTIGEERKNIFCYDYLPRLDAAFVDEWVLQNGLQRLHSKIDKFKTWRDQYHLDYDELLYRGIMDALGFSKNRAPFRKLSALVSYRQLRSAIRHDKPETALMRLQAILLGAAGLLDPVQHDANDPSMVPFIQRLENLWLEFQNKFRVQAMKAAEWKLFRLRPANFPTVRIAGLSKLLMNHESLFSEFKVLLETSGAPAHELQSRIIVPSFGYWGGHYWWGDEGHHGNHDLIGKQRAFEITVNAVLPVLALFAEDQNEKDLTNRIFHLYQTTPSQEANSVIRFMKLQLRSGMNKKKYSIQYAQGLIHLNKRCAAYHCAECPIFEETVHANLCREYIPGV